MKKRILALLLVCVLLTGVLSACGGEEKKPDTLMLGYGVADITPAESIPLAGYQGSNSAEFRRSTGTEWPFHAVCIAFTDTTGKTLVLVVLDLLNASMADGLRDVLSGKLNVPKSNIMVHATHNHSGPATKGEDPAITPYVALMTNGVVAAAEAAMANRKPVTGMQTTYARPEGYNSERHYLLADGSYQSYAVGSVPKDQLIGHFGVADNLFQLVKFTREGAKDVVIANWQGHPPGTDPNTIATSNYPGVLRDYLDKNLNCESIFVLGGTGNLNNNSQIAGEIVHDNYQELGQNLGKTAVEAASKFVERNVGDITINEKMLQLENRNYGANKVWVYAVSIGDFAFVTAPFEIFDDNAVAVRESSPYAMTMYVTCCNGSNGYLPTPYSYYWEITYESRITSFPEGTAEIVQDELIGMIKENADATGYQTVEKEADYYQAEFVPKSNGKTYINPDAGNTTNYTEAKNDFYAFQLLDGSKIKNFLSKDEELVKQILGKSQVQLVVDEQNVVVGIAD